MDFFDAREYLIELELSKHLDEAEFDGIRSVVAFSLLRDTNIDVEDVYAFVFGKGRHLNWN